MFRLAEYGSLVAMGLMSAQLAVPSRAPAQGSFETAFLAQTPVQVQAPTPIQGPSQISPVQQAPATPAQSTADQSASGQAAPGQAAPGQTSNGPAPAGQAPAGIASPAPAGVAGPGQVATSVPAAIPPSGPPPSPEELGDSLAVHQRYQAALEAYTKAPPSAAVWNKMGIAYQMMFNLKAATRCYKESLALDPKNPNVLNNLATIYDSTKQFGQAEKYYKKALKLDPKSALVLKNLGTNLLSQHHYGRGWEMYQQALAIDPEIFEDRNSPQVQNPASVQERGVMNYYMALGCARMGQTSCALEYLRRAMDEGYTTPKKVASDLAFAGLRDNPDFKLLLASQKNAKPEQSR
jgi:Tfp pilus assembly protein PilF